MNRSYKLLTVAVLASAAFAGGCSDASPTAGPSLATTTTTSTDTFTYTVADGVSDADLADGMTISVIGNVRIVSFTVYPSTNATLSIDEHKIAFEPNAICDTLQSSYGTEYWSSPCPVAQYGVRVTATSWYTASGKPVIDFQPALRFNPDSRVTLYLKNKNASKDDKVLWVTPLGQLVDESLTDPTLATRTGGGYKYRRVKHFSGYTVSTSRTGSFSSDYLRRSVGPMQVGASLQPLSGHVVATGAARDAQLPQ